MGKFRGPDVHNFTSAVAQGIDNLTVLVYNKVIPNSVRLEVPYMPKRGLSSQQIYEAALKLVVEKGYDNFSLRELAARLGVQPPSLYSHVKNAKEISTAVGVTATSRLSASLKAAITDKPRDEAFFAFAYAYRDFAQQNPELYRAIMALPAAEDERLRCSEQQTIAPLRALVECFVTTNENVINFQRFFRSAIHGFLSLQSIGFMRSSDVSAEESYTMLVAACLRELKAAEKQESSQKEASALEKR